MDLTSLHTRLWANIDGQKDKHVSLLRRLVQLSQGGEEATQEAVASEFGKLGCEVEVVRQDPRRLRLKDEFAADLAVPPGERVSVVGRFRGGGGRSLLFFAHPDGEPLDGLDHWQHPPFDGAIENGRLYGWAVADDLLGVAIMTSALEAVLSSGVGPEGDVILASAASKRHAQGIIAILDRGYRADGAVYLHPAESGAGMKEIKAFTSGMLHFRIRVPGQPPDTREPSHTAFYHLAVNPIDKAWLLYRGLQDLAALRAAEVHHPLMEEAIGRSTNLQVSFFHCGDEAHLSRVSSECIMAGSISFPSGESLAQVQRQVTQAVESVSKEDEWLRDNPPRIEWLMGTSAVETPADHPLYRTVSGAVEAVTGEEPRVYPLHSASDIRNPWIHAGIPTVGLGSLCGDLTQAGGHDEWVDLEDYLRAIKICASVIVDWCVV